MKKMVYERHKGINSLLVKERFFKNQNTNNSNFSRAESLIHSINKNLQKKRQSVANSTNVVNASNCRSEKHVKDDEEC